MSEELYRTFTADLDRLGLDEVHQRLEELLERKVRLNAVHRSLKQQFEALRDDICANECQIRGVQDALTATVQRLERWVWEREGGEP